MEKSSQKRVRAAAKFFYENSEKFWIRGVTYGTFEPHDESDYPAPDQVARDFSMMREAGINTVRIYTAPPGYLMDEAERQNIRLIVGLTWMQHVCFLDDPQLVKQIREEIGKGVRACADHPAVFAFAIGNEIPAQIVRWHGVRKIEEFLKRIYDDVKSIAPHIPVTYVNYPPTDYLDLSFLDFVSFNVFLHREEDFKAYISKLHNIAGNRPLVLTEIGLDSIRHGEDEQSRFLSWQIREAYQGGAAGVCIFSWTDDWHRGGNRVTDWAFGAVDIDRIPKLAYSAVKSSFLKVPFDDETRGDWPKVSVVICAYNAANTIQDNLDSLSRLNYPNYEVIVVNDGSQDQTAGIIAKYPFKIISVPNGGLSAARNLGWRAATGEIIAYTDADTRVDPDWLSYLVQPFLNTDAVGVGGPNVVPEDDEWVAQCVARSPGGPTHVLLNDTVAEHIPGCNMAFRRRALAEVGGFDPIYTKAGDDVDICWRLQEQGWHLAFSPSALVWHHHRNSVKAYWRQQVGYGEGESFLEHRHQEKFNERGMTRWQGRIYSHLPAYRSLFKSVIYHGRWGSAAFPSVYQRVMDNWKCLPLMVEWQAATAFTLIGAVFMPRMLVLTTLMMAVTAGRCLSHARSTKIDDLGNIDSLHTRIKYRLMIAFLHYIQLWARFRGRIKGYFSPNVNTPDEAPRLSPVDALRLLFYRLDVTYWDTHYTLIENFLLMFRRAGETTLAPVRCDNGWQHDYDLHVHACRTCSFKIKLTAEDHGGFKRLFRMRIKLHRSWRFVTTAVMAMAFGAYVLHSVGESWILSILLAFSLTLIMMLLRVSRRGGQVVAALETVARELKLYSLAGTRPAGGEEREPAQDVGR